MELASKAAFCNARLLARFSHLGMRGEVVLERGKKFT